MQPSPYTPGTVTHHLVGRDRQLTDIQRDLALIAQFPRFSGRIQVFVGPRGVGKTSLLRTVQVDAQQADLHTIWVTAGDGNFLLELVESFSRYAQNWRSKTTEKLKALLSTLKVTVAGISISAPENHPTTSHTALGRQLQEVLVSAVQAARNNGLKGIVLFVDEIQSADANGLRALAYAWQHMQSENPDLPALALTAGLSHSIDVITDAVSFAERFSYTHLGNLPADAATQALITPAARLGVSWADGALPNALDIAHGYPYFLQLIGDLTWKAADYPDGGTLLLDTHVAEALENFRTERDSFFRARWMKATAREIEFITAMAAIAQKSDTPDEAWVKRGDIAERLGVSTTAVSMARRSLMDKGLIAAPEFGQLSFTAPGFVDFVTRTTR